MAILTIKQDLDPENPRAEWDNLGTFALFHKRYSLGDKHDIRQQDFSSWNEMYAYISKKLKAAVILPIYLYDHSGLTISHRPFHCDWDSGQIGFAYVTKEKALEEFGGKRVGMNLRHKVFMALKAEIKTYDQYLTGDVWCYEIKNRDGEDIECGYGIYGREDCEQLGNEALTRLENQQ